MFDPEFFPTPRDLAQTLCCPYFPAIAAGEITAILDPSAGKGDLLRPFVRGPHERQYCTLYAMERSPELRAILAAAKDETNTSRRNEAKPYFKVIGEDFFEYVGRHRFDLIVMNPPFSEGIAHLQRAFELLAPGGRLACILSAAAVRNPTKVDEVTLQALRGFGASFTFKADAFKNAERPTDVEIAIIRVQKPAAATPAFDFSGARKANTRTYIDELAPEDIEGQIAKQDTIGNMALCFDNAAKALSDLATCWKRADFYLGGLGLAMAHVTPVEQRATAYPSNLNSMLDEVTKEAWANVAARCNLSHLFTTRLERDFHSFMQAQGSLDFNAVNIRAFLRMLMASRTQISEQCILDVFDKMCAYDKANVLHVEGWKTNSGHRVNKKVIMPGFLFYEKLWGFRLGYHHETASLNDIDKALCHVMGKPYESILKISAVLTSAFRNRESDVREGESEFFNLRWFKKGTLHLVFKDVKVWELFNIAAAQGRGWLGKAA